MLIVVKLGGKVLEENLSMLIREVKDNLSNVEFVLIHGGGSEVTHIASKMGKKQKFVTSPKGFRSRYTDKETIEIYTMVMVGRINKRIISALQREGICGVGLSGIDGFLVEAKRKKRIIIVDERGRKRVIQGGYTGQICRVRSKLLKLLLNNGFVPVIAPIALSKDFEPLNVNGDRMAAHIAGALKADKLLLLTDVSGILVDGKILSKTTTSELEKILPTLGPGMTTKAYATIEALKLGVGEVIISSGLKDKPITSSLNQKEGGTVVNHD
ncbi:MAG: [LysW]-aminoadipate/[LysW]-glutamate kinase [Thermoproteota archaeon]